VQIYFGLALLLLNFKFIIAGSYCWSKFLTDEPVLRIAAHIIPSATVVSKVIDNHTVLILAVVIRLSTLPISVHSL